MKILRAILLGGLVAGAFDITYALATYYFAYDIPPIRVFQAVAGGWLGREAARAGGMDSAILGAITHFSFTTLMATAYVIVSLFMTDLRRHPIFWGMLYGSGLYFLMNFVVVPNSALGWPKQMPPLWIWYSGLVVHQFGVGCSIALIARWLLGAPETTQPATSRGI